MKTKALNLEFLEEDGDKEGRYVMVKGKIDHVLVPSVNVHGPPESDRKFFKSVFDKMISVSEGL